MRIYTLILATFCICVSLVSMSHQSLAQSSFGSNDINDSYRTLTIRRHAIAYGNCGAIDCEPIRSDAYDSDANALDPFSNCVSGCDVDTIFRALTGRPNEGWKR